SDHAARITQADEDDIDVVVLEPSHGLADSGIEVRHGHLCQGIRSSKLPQHKVCPGECDLVLDALCCIGGQFPRHTPIHNVDIQTFEIGFEEALDHRV